MVVVDELKLFFHSYNISNDADSKSLLIENTHIERTSGYEKRTLSIRWPLPRFYRSPPLIHSTEIMPVLYVFKYPHFLLICDASHALDCVIKGGKQSPYFSPHIFNVYRAYKIGKLDRYHFLAFTSSGEEKRKTILFPL